MIAKKRGELFKRLLFVTTIVLAGLALAISFANAEDEFDIAEVQTENVALKSFEQHCIYSKWGNSELYDAPELVGDINVSNSTVVRIVADQDVADDYTATHYSIIALKAGSACVSYITKEYDYETRDYKFIEHIINVAVTNQKIALEKYGPLKCIEDYYGYGSYEVIKASSKDKNVVTIRYDKENSVFEIVPAGVGKTVVSCTLTGGMVADVDVVVGKNYMNAFLKDCTYHEWVYGSRYVLVETRPYVNVTIKSGGKKYKKKANKEGMAKIKVPIKKKGTQYTVETAINGGVGILKGKVYSDTWIKAFSTVYRGSKKVVVRVENAHKGDYIIVKIGKKTYKKKIKKDAKNKKYTIKIKKKKKAGSKYQVIVYNKFKQKLDQEKDKVYYASKLKKGMTKKQCKLVPGWEHPKEIYVSGRFTTWWYDDDDDGYADDSYLEFYKGKLYGWHW